MDNKKQVKKQVKKIDVSGLLANTLDEKEMSSVRGSGIMISD